TANKFVMMSGLSAECITFYIQAIICVMSFVIAWKKRCPIRIKPKLLVRLLMVGSIGMGATSFLISSACMCIPVGLTTVLHFLYPTIVSVAMVLFFGQKLSGYKGIAIVCSIFGMLLITNLDGAGGAQWIGILLALASSLTYSFYMISNEKGEINQLPLIVKLFYASMGSALLFGVISVGKGSIALPGTWSAGFVLVAVSSLGSLGAFYLITAGIQRIGASAASFVNMLEPVTSVVASALVYQECPSLVTWMGILLVLSSVFLVAMDGRRTTACEVEETKE
ncbi:MAG: DMT family transporter, partial [Lawsonibacter sp.]